jgi:hypothetical protein
VKKERQKRKGLPKKEDQGIGTEVVNKDKQAGIYKKGRFDGQAIFSPIII